MTIHQDNKLKNNILECCWIGERFVEHISKASNPTRAAHMVSVFDGTANVKTHDNRLLVITKNAVRSPITLNIMQYGEIHSLRDYVKFGSTVWDDGTKLLFENRDGGSVVIDLRKSKLFKQKLEPLTKNSLSKFRDVHDSIFYSLLKFVKPGSLLQPDITNEGLLSEQIGSVTNIEKKIDNDSEFVFLMVDILGKFCGRGPGYTPSGDDFITGYLTMFNWCAKCLNFNRIELPLHYANLTSWTSFKMIKYGMECVCDEEMQALINSIARGMEKEFLANIGPISYRGHTSGIDLVTGVICALYTMVDRVFGTSILRKLLPCCREGRGQNNGSNFLDGTRL